MFIEKGVSLMSRESRLKRLGIDPNLPPSKIFEKLAEIAPNEEKRAKALALAERAKKIEVPGD